MSYTFMSMLCNVTLSKQEVKTFFAIKGIKSMVVKAIKTQELFRLRVILMDKYLPRTHSKSGVK